MENTFKEKAEQEAKPSPTKRKFSLLDLINGNILIQDYFIGRLPFIFFLVFLMTSFIGYRYYAEKTFRSLVGAEKQLEELKSENVTIKSKLMVLSRPSRVIAKINQYGLGLEAATEPPKKIIIKKQNN